MATNRDDINKMSNEELAATIMAKVSVMPGFSSISGFTDAAKEISDWLSLEYVDVEEHKIKKIELTEQEYKDILARLDKLESKIQNEEKTADQMFKNLGYYIDKKYETPITILYNHIEEDKQIIIDKVSLHFGKRNKNNVPMLITESEDIAIHKKISEMKNENGGDVKCNVSSQ